MSFAIATPKEYNLDQASLDLARQRAGDGKVEVLATVDPTRRLKGLT